MPQLHIANTFFEHEIAHQSKSCLHSTLHCHPLFLQLQYLPFLYGAPEDGVLLTHSPPLLFLEKLQQLGIHGPKCWHLLSEKKSFSYASLESWGMSPLVNKWAKASRLSYPMPSWEVICEVNSKAFSFSNSPLLPHARLLYTSEALDEWTKTFDGRKVLKTCYGLSGSGHFHIVSPDDVLKACAFASNEWQKGLPVLAEPWVKRLLDFSTQWLITPQGAIEYLGATLCENDPYGRYQATRVGHEPDLFADFFPYLLQHKSAVAPLLNKIASLGFFGNIGIDAMIYDDNLLHPVVEINARKTMGWVALEIARRHFPQKTIRISLAKTNAFSNALLPSEIAPQIQFPKQLVLQIV